LTTGRREVVASLEEALASRIGAPRFHFWFHEKTRFRCADGMLSVGVPNHFYQELLEDRFAGALCAAAAEVFGRTVQVRFEIDPELFRAARRAEAQCRGETSLPADRRPSSEPADPLPAPRRTTAPERQWRQLDDFVVGPCNRVAHASALSVVEAPAEVGYPLVLHGPIGTGKTHLLEGIHAGLRRSRPTWDVRFLTAESFTNQFLHAMHSGGLASFRARFRACDALLVDDLHFLAGKKATQEEFLHTFDTLLARGKPVVVTCDCHPRLSDDFCPELADRLLGGGVWGLMPPDAETRRAILRARAVRGGPPLPDEVLGFLADQLRGNVRELEGALHSVRHFSRVAGRPIDLPLAREAVADLLRHSVRSVQLADIDQAVCRALRLQPGTLQSKQRTSAVSHPRMLAIYLARKYTSAAYSEIGQYFGGRNHSTAVAAEKKVRRWLENNAELLLGHRRPRIREVLELAERELQR
jgi:chromosomal replication initiator protein